MFYLYLVVIYVLLLGDHHPSSCASAAISGSSEDACWISVYDESAIAANNGAVRQIVPSSLRNVTVRRIRASSRDSSAIIVDPLPEPDNRTVGQLLHQPWRETPFGGFVQLSRPSPLHDDIALFAFNSNQSEWGASMVYQNELEGTPNGVIRFASSTNVDKHTVGTIVESFLSDTNITRSVVYKMDILSSECMKAIPQFVALSVTPQRIIADDLRDITVSPSHRKIRFEITSGGGDSGVVWNATNVSTASILTRVLLQSDGGGDDNDEFISRIVGFTVTLISDQIIELEIKVSPKFLLLGGGGVNEEERVNVTFTSGAFSCRRCIGSAVFTIRNAEPPPRFAIDSTWAEVSVYSLLGVAVMDSSLSCDPSAAAVAVRAFAIMHEDCRDVFGANSNAADALPFVYSPISISIGDSRVSYHLAALLVNSGVVLAFILLHAVAASVFSSFASRRWIVAAAALRFPSMGLVLAAALAQPTASSAAIVFLYSGEMFLELISILFFLLWASIPLFIVFQTALRRPFPAWYILQPRGVAALYFYGRGEWRSDSKSSSLPSQLSIEDKKLSLCKSRTVKQLEDRGSFLGMFGFIFQAVAPGREWFLAVEFTIMIGVGVASAIRAEKRYCEESVYILIGILGVHAVLTFLFWPFAALHAQLSRGAVVALQLAAVLFMQFPSKRGAPGTLALLSVVLCGTMCIANLLAYAAKIACGGGDRPQVPPTHGGIYSGSSAAALSSSPTSVKHTRAITISPPPPVRRVASSLQLQQRQRPPVTAVELISSQVDTTRKWGGDDDHGRSKQHAPLVSPPRRSAHTHHHHGHLFNPLDSVEGPTTAAVRSMVGGAHQYHHHHPDGRGGDPSSPLIHDEGCAELCSFLSSFSSSSSEMSSMNDDDDQRRRRDYHRSVSPPSRRHHRRHAPPSGRGAAAVVVPTHHRRRVLLPPHPAHRRRGSHNPHRSSYDLINPPVGSGRRYDSDYDDNERFPLAATTASPLRRHPSGRGGDYQPPLWSSHRDGRRSSELQGGRSMMMRHGVYNEGGEVRCPLRPVISDEPPPQQQYHYCAAADRGRCWYPPPQRVPLPFDDDPSRAHGCYSSRGASRQQQAAAVESRADDDAISVPQLPPPSSSQAVGSDAYRDAFDAMLRRDPELARMYQVL